MRKVKFFTVAGAVGTAAMVAGAAHAAVEISNQPTLNMSCVGGVCTATADKARLNVTDLANMLASGDVAVKTGSLTGDIELKQPLGWTSGSRLTLDAKRTVEIDKAMSVTGSGALTIVTNDGGSGGEFVIFPERGSVQFWDLNSSLIINGQTYTLVGDIKTLAADIAANPSGFYALAKDYDASADGTYSTSPIGTEFQGAFEGLGNSITRFTMHSETISLSGLFAAIGSSGTVSSLAILNADVSAAQNNGNAILVDNNQGKIMFCRVSGTIAFKLGVDAGGLASFNQGAIISSLSDTRITSTVAVNAAGGLAGYNLSGTISGSEALRTLGLQNTTDTNVGGLVGESSGLISNSFSRASVKDRRGDSDSNFGGLLGKNDASATVRSSYSAGLMTFSGQDNVLIGGLIGVDQASTNSISDSYWDLDMGVGDPSQGAGNIANDPGITGLTTQQLKSSLPAGFDPKIWALDPKINDGFPYLRMLPVR